jgi:D-alanine-D-alanine ligase
MKKINVAVLMGGESSEHDVSLASGRMIFAALDKNKYRVLPAVISKKGEWRFGFGETARKFKIGGALQELAKKKIDCVLIALHGPFGEDGRVQAVLELAGIPYTGSGVLASALAMDKAATKKILAGAGIPMPGHVVLKKDYRPTELKNIKLPVVVKPLGQGSSVGISIVEKGGDLLGALKKSFRFEAAAMVEEFIRGREITASVLGNKKPKVLPLIEIRPKVSRFFDYRAKYEVGGSDEICPAPISRILTEKIQAAAVKAHRIMGCCGVTRSDFILRGGKPYFLEINTIPGMTKTSLVPQAAKKAGISFPALLDELVKLALFRD